jgi:hypothetical protein
MKKLIKFLAMGLMLSPLLCFSFDVLFMDIKPSFDLKKETLPKNLRVFSPFIVVDASYNLLGWEDIKASSSGQFSEETFVALLEKLFFQAEKLVIVDLRAESHGFVNGLSVCWRNCLNDLFDKTSEKVEEEENARLAQAIAEGYLLIESSENQLELPIFRAITERALVEDAGYTYARFPLSNHHRPSDQFVDQFVQFVKSLSSDEWVHFHSAVGKRRTKLMITLLDIIKNGDRVSLEDILIRQQILDVEFASKDKEFIQTDQDRLAFLNEFYTYVQQVPDCEIPWSVWTQQQYLIDEATATINTVKRSFAFNNSLSTSNKTTYDPKMNRAIYNLFQIPLLRSSRHHSNRNPGDNDRGGNDRGGWECSGGITYKWGGNENTWEFQFKGEGHDGNGNYIEGEAQGRSDGTGQAGVHGGHASK